MRTRITHTFATLLAVFGLALSVGLAPASAAPDRDDAASAAALLGVASEICGQTGDTHAPCPFCMLPDSDQPTRATDPRDVALPQDHMLRAGHQTLRLIPRKDGTSPRAPPHTSPKNVTTFL